MKPAQTETGTSAVHATRSLPHPAVTLLLWIMLALAIPLLRATPLLALGGLLALAVLRFSAVRFLTLLRRTRWIMLSLLLVYGYATPGGALVAPLGTWSPTLEGLGEGLLQLWRLLLALAALSIVLALLPREALISGIYTLSYPLRYLGLSRERVAVRLALTLRYAESAAEQVAADWRDALARMLVAAPAETHTVELQATPLTWHDGLLLAGGAALLVVLL